MKKTIILTFLLTLLAGLVFAASSSRVQPIGKKVGLVQFDAILQMNMDRYVATTTLFARYWVSQDLYALATVWSEPNGRGFMKLANQAVLSDAHGWKLHGDLFPDSPNNKIYPQATGDRPPFQWGAGLYHIRDSRFADSAAKARRVYMSDLGPLLDPGQEGTGSFEIQIPRSTDQAARTIGMLRVNAKNKVIEMMEVLDRDQQLICKVNYHYGPEGDRLSRLTALLPTRPQKLLADANVVMQISDGDGIKEQTIRIDTVDHVHHKGGRICAVTYKDVTLGNEIVRLPVYVEVRRADDSRVLRTAELTNFRLVQMDKDQVWQAARAFAGLTQQDRDLRQLVKKYLRHRARLGPPSIDPNDTEAVMRLIARYPVPEGPTFEPIELHFTPREPNRTPNPEDYEKRRQEFRQERMAFQQLTAERKQQLIAWHQEFERGRKTKQVEPNDARLIRQLMNHYSAVIGTLTEEQEKELDEEKGTVSVPWTDETKRASELERKLRSIWSYYIFPDLPEDLPPSIEPNDMQLIRQLQAYYQDLAKDNPNGKGGLLRALNGLTRIDLLLKDWDRYEKHVLEYLRVLEEAGLYAVYADSAWMLTQGFLDAGQYQRANRFMQHWCSVASRMSDPNDVLRFAYVQSRGWAQYWPSTKILEGLLRRGDLTPIQRYQALALRAIGLHMVDGLLARGLNNLKEDSQKSTARWILTATTYQQIASQVSPAIQQAVSAWRSLGPAAFDQARPYMAPASDFAKYVTQAPDSTPLQEISAMLDQIVRQRSGQVPQAQPAQGQTERPTIRQPVRQPKRQPAARPQRR